MAWTIHATTKTREDGTFSPMLVISDRAHGIRKFIYPTSYTSEDEAYGVANSFMKVLVEIAEKIIIGGFSLEK